MNNLNFKNTYPKFVTAVEVAIVFYLLIFVGWVLNLCWIASSDFSTFTGPLLLRIFGVVLFPLGSILGYIGIFTY